MTRRPRPDKTAYDRHLWEAVTRGVKPLQPAAVSSPRAAATTTTATTAATTRLSPASARTAPARKEGASRSLAPSPQPHHPRAREVDAATLRRFRAGKMPLDATLDLHGLTEFKAHTALKRFVLHHHARGSRCLLIITGKGARAKGQRSPEGPPPTPLPGVLRRCVPLWLEETPLNALLLATAPARPAHGGTGALYLLLRRHRANVRAVPLNRNHSH